MDAAERAAWEDVSWDIRDGDVVDVVDDVLSEADEDLGVAHGICHRCGVSHGIADVRSTGRLFLEAGVVHHVEFSSDSVVNVDGRAVQMTTTTSSTTVAQVIL